MILKTKTYISKIRFRLYCLYFRYYSIEELFKWNVSTEMKNCFGQAPLVYGLCKESSDRIIATLINHGCDINVSDNKGLTCLHYASYKKSPFIAQKLIENGADIDCTSNKGNTALHMGVQVGNLEYICMLLYYGVSVNEVNSFERTPLHDAIALDYKIIAQHLLNYIIDFNAKDEDDNTYLHMALHQQNGVVIDLLKECDINVLSKGEHSLYRAVKARSSYEILQILWMKTDFKMFLSSLHYISFLDEFCECYNFLPNEQFITFLYAMFDSSCLDDFLRQRDRLREDIPFIHHLFTRRELLFQFLEPGERLELILVLLSFGINIYFEDICYLYQVYGFDENIELLLMIGNYIHIGPGSSSFHNLVVSRICYDNLDIYIDNKRESTAHEKLNGIFNANDLNAYCKFYKATFDDVGAHTLIQHGISAIGEISSLLEISRDTVRKVIYENYRTSYSFFVYDAISKLPVPTAIKDILFLRRPIYD